MSEEWSAARLERAQRIISERGLHPLTVVQPEYNMMDRYIEHEIVDVCDYYNIGITPFSPLAQGLLTGKYRKGQPLPAGSRATWQSDHQINDLLTDENLDKVEALRGLADGLGMKWLRCPCLGFFVCYCQFGDRRCVQAFAAGRQSCRVWSGIA